MIEMKINWLIKKAIQPSSVVLSYIAFSLYVTSFSDKKLPGDAEQPGVYCALVITSGYN